jgi:ferric-dicitrate binding protein FerR (iron transport regulator)
VKKEYLQYTPEELIQDREFISLVLRGKNQAEWENFQEGNPEFKSTLKKAREIVGLLRDGHENLTEDEILQIWKNIDKFDDQQRRQPKSFTLNRILRYAAVLVFALLLAGTAGYFLINQKNDAYVFTNSPENAAGKQSRLILSNGTTVDLTQEDSKIVMNTDQQIVIENNQVIDMSDASEAEDSKMNEVVIPFGNKSQLILPDGTKVWLNAGSRMAFPNKFSGKKREVFLEGEAYFEVTHNANLPFFVNTKDISIKVLGTKFNVSAYKTDKVAETVLLEGKVAVKELSSMGFMMKETMLAPNQKASFNKENKTISVQNERDADFAIAWTEGWFKFSQQNLNTVLNKLQRYYNVQFEYDPNFSTADMITGKLDLKESIEQTMVALGDVANIQYRINGDKIQIEKKINGIKMR